MPAPAAPERDDLMLGRGVSEAVERFGPAYPWGDLLPTLHAADLRLVNLECALTAITERWRGDPHKPFFFRAPPADVAVLRAARIGGVTLANNHAADFGMDGLRETLDTLDGAGIAHVGAGADRRAATAPAIVVARGVRVALLGFADHPAAWAAGDAAPGIAWVPTTADGARRIADAVAAARAAADVVIVAMHWGPNMRDRPTAEFRAFAARVVDAGADVFWGHSAHVVQGVERRGARLVLHDTGDLVDDYVVDPALRNDLGALFLVHVATDPPRLARLEVVPVRIARRRARLAAGDDRDWLLDRVGALSRELGTALVRREDRLALDLGVSPSRA